MLTIKNLHLVKSNKEILKNINFSMEKELVILFGVSWSWKTSIFNCLLWVEQFDWEIILNNQVLNNIPLEKRGISIVFQDFLLFEHYNIEKNINIGKNINTKLRDELIDKLNIKPLLHKYPHQLSWWEIQRIAFLRAIINNPKLLLLDEPFSNLDKINKDIFMNEIKDILIKLEIPIILITHDINDIKFLDKKIFIIKDWEIIEEWKLDKILQNNNWEHKKYIEDITKK